MTAGSGGQRTIAVVCVFAKNGMDHRCINEHANYRWFSPPYAADCTLDDVLASTVRIYLLINLLVQLL
ncbi:unnamed protein product [Rhodiola kirilowii]